jgi:anaerobic magnesium-protoporphyrin IX monomethyl ester cyclase
LACHVALSEPIMKGFAWQTSDCSEAILPKSPLWRDSLMRIVLLNPPHTAIGSRVPGELLPPLGLLAIGGPLLDAGHEVRLLNADLAPMTDDGIIANLKADPPEAVLVGHSGSTSAHLMVLRLAALIRAALPVTRIIYGGVYPS